MKLNKIQKQFLRIATLKLIWFVPIWIFLLAIQPFLQGKDLILMIMQSTFYWILFVASVVVLVAIELSLENPEIRLFFTRIEKADKPAGQKEKKSKEKEPIY